MAMGSDQVTSRRAMLASLVLAVPAAANAMVPGLNGPGLVPAKKVPKSTSTGFGRDFETIRDKSNFWSSQGVRRTPRCLPATAAAPHDAPFFLHMHRAVLGCHLPPARALAPSDRHSKCALSHETPARLWQIMDSVPKMKGIITPKTGGFKTK